MTLPKTIGKHEIEVVGDILFMKFHGPFSGADAEGIIQVIEQTFRDSPYYAVLDTAEMGQLEAIARKRFTAWTVDRNFLGAAIFGANLTTRTLTILVQSGIRLLGKKIIPIVFVKEAKEGRAWIAEQKRKAAAHGGS